MGFLVDKKSVSLHYESERNYRWRSRFSEHWHLPSGCHQNGILLGKTVLVGLGCVAASLLVRNQIASTIIGGFAFSCLWGIHEMFLQEKRVLKGWFPENPKRHAYYAQKRAQMGIKL